MTVLPIFAQLVFKVEKKAVKLLSEVNQTQILAFSFELRLGQRKKKNKKGEIANVALSKIHVTTCPQLIDKQV